MILHGGLEHLHSHADYEDCNEQDRHGDNQSENAIHHAFAFHNFIFFAG